jgi:CBS domain-containing protein
MLVEESMSTDLVTCQVDTSLQNSVGCMLRNRVGSVIVLEAETPVGIVTETDTIHAGYVTERPFTDIPIRKVMSNPLITISPKKTLRRATQRMDEDGVKKLVVVEDMDLLGILTTQDIVENYHELKADVTDIVRQDRWGSDDLSDSRVGYDPDG